MNRLVPHRPHHVRIRRHVGSLPHGLPTALLFTASVVALMLGTVLVVDKAIPTLMEPDRDHDLTIEAATESPTEGARTVAPTATEAESPSETPSPRGVLVKVPISRDDGSGATVSPATRRLTGRAFAPLAADTSTPRHLDPEARPLGWRWWRRRGMGWRGRRRWARPVADAPTGQRPRPGAPTVGHADADAATGADARADAASITHASTFADP